MNQTAKPEAPAGTDNLQVDVPQTRMLELFGNAVTQRMLGQMQLSMDSLQEQLQGAQLEIKKKNGEIESLKGQLAEFEKNAAAIQETSKT